MRNVLALALTLAASLLWHADAFADDASDCEKGAAATCMKLAMRAKDPAKATEYLEKTCERAGMEGCRLLAQRLLLGRTVPPDPKRAYELARLACDSDHLPACLDLGRMEKDEVKAIHLFDKGCLADDPDGCFELGMRLRGEKRGQGFLQRSCSKNHPRGCGELARLLATSDLPRALATAEKGCKLGAPEGCLALAEMYKDSPAKEKAAKKRYQQALEKKCRGGDLATCRAIAQAGDEKAAKAAQKDACKLGDGWACLVVDDYDAACRYGNGEGCVKLAARAPDAAVAMNLLRAACQRKVGAACEKVAEGEEPAKAAELLEKSCEAGSGTGCVALGKMYFEGRVGGSKDPTRAANLWKRGCELGARTGCVRRARILVTGAPGCPRDLPGARATFEDACSSGDGDGCVGLAELYETGTGVKRDVPFSRRLRRYACDYGDTGACLDLAKRYEGEKDAALAVAFHYRACAARVAEGCDGVDRVQKRAAVLTPTEAREPALRRAFLEKACEKGHPHGCYEVGQILAEKNPQATKERERMFTRACDLGAPWGCTESGAAKKGCDAGDGEACVKVGNKVRACELGVGDDCDGKPRPVRP